MSKSKKRKPTKLRAVDVKRVRTADAKLRMKPPKTATISSTHYKGADLKIVVTERRSGEGDAWSKNAFVEYTIDGLPVNVEAYMATVFTMMLGADDPEQVG